MIKGTCLAAMCALVISLRPAMAQKARYTLADSLMGGQRPERTAFDVRHYDIAITPDFAGQSIQGRVRMLFRVAPNAPGRIQIELDSLLTVDSLTAGGSANLSYERKHRALFVNLPAEALQRFKSGKDSLLTLTMIYHGSARKAARPPWDGGLIWRKDSVGRDWLTTACQGDGASLWWPCKDDLADEPEQGVTISYTVPRLMVAVSNGRLINKQEKGDLATYTYRVSYPINTYNVAMNVGYYTLRQHTIDLPSGKKLDFEVAALDYHIDSYDKYLDFEAQRTLKTFSGLFGDYPWIDDGYRLVEVPYWGMEHQSCVAYGNKLKNNKFGYDFIVVHETGHEWWGNEISISDNADFWIHEGICTYSEVLFLEKVKGKSEGERYMKEWILKNMTAKGPVVGPRGVNYMEDGTEAYYRGAAIMHLFRYMLNDDKLFMKTLNDILGAHQRRPASTESVLAVINKSTKQDFRPLFMQYLTEKGFPVLEHSVANGKLRFRLGNSEKGLNLPVTVKVGEEVLTLHAKSSWQSVPLHKDVKTNNVATVDLIQPSYLLKTESVPIQK